MIQIEHLVKTYGVRTVVDDLSMRVERGSVFGFLGPNGAGKTTLIKMIVRLAHPDSGSILIDGKSPDDIAMRAQIGFMPENPYFYDHLTGIEFLEFCNQLSGGHAVFDRAGYERALGEVGIEDAADRKIRTYSKGMRQRLGFAQAIIHDPAYVFLDEPLDGLDPLGRKEMKGMILRLKKRGKTIFFNSHILSDVEEICDAIGIIHKGALLYSGTVRDFSKDKSLEARFVERIEAVDARA